jgi:hypothetical protein
MANKMSHRPPKAEGKESIETRTNEGDLKSYLDHIKKVNDVFYDQMKIADQKAAYLFTFMLAFLVSSSEGRGVFNIARYREGLWGEALVSGLMALSVMFTLVCAIMVVLPRNAPNGTTLYWGSWPMNRARFLAASHEGPSDFLLLEYTRNVDNLAAICGRKFFFVGTAFRGLLVAVLSYVVLLGLFK